MKKVFLIVKWEIACRGHGDYQREAQLTKHPVFKTQKAAEMFVDQLPYPKGYGWLEKEFINE